MKKSVLSILLFAALAVAFCACDSENQPGNKKKVDYDKMVGNWQVTSYTVQWINLDENEVLKDIALRDGSLSITKKTEDGETYYYYTENFVSEDRKEYSGRIDAGSDFIVLGNSEGFLRGDGADTYDYSVSFPSDNEMHWDYSYQGTRSVDGVAHQEKRTVKGVFKRK